MIDVINNITTYEDTYYSFGEYIYNIIQPNVTGNLDMFKFSKSFAIIAIIAIIFSLGLRTPWIGIQIIMGYAIIKIVWNIFTK